MNPLVASSWHKSISNNSGLHYDNTFGFGYLAAFYEFVAPVTLRDPDKLTNLINQVGFYAMLIGMLCFWCAVCIVHGTHWSSSGSAR
jgi:hypothetical protein